MKELSVIVGRVDAAGSIERCLSGFERTCRGGDSGIIVVGHKKHYRVLEYLGQRYLYARSHAGLKRGDMTLAVRALFILGTVALPPVLLVRVARRVLANRCHRVEFVRALPPIALFVCAWAAGETVGFAFGLGDVLSHVR